MAQEACVIEQGIAINGRLTGEDEVTVRGRIEGTISLNNHLFVDEGGVVVAEAEVQTLTIRGEFNGDVVAHELATLQAGCAVTGNIRAPRIVIEEGARFKGNIDMDVELAQAQ